MILELLRHETFVTIITGWLIAGLIKYLLDRKEKISLIRELFRTGGMPSAHTTIVSALTMSVWYLQGSSTLFVACLVFSTLVIRDSFGVRYSVGEQATLINKLAQHDHLKAKVRVVMGHTLSQAVVGGVLGIFVAFFVHALA